MTASVSLERVVQGPGYWRRVADDVRHELPGLLGANAFFLAWCIPSVALLMVGFPALAVLVTPVTIGPGVAGLGTYTGRLVRGEGARWRRDSVDGVRARSAACIILVALGLGAAILPVMALRLTSAQGMTVAAMAVLTVQALVAACLVVTCVHGWGLVALYGQPTGMALRNAAILTIRRPFSSAGPVGLGLIFVHVAQVFGWGLLVVLPAVLALCAVHHTHRLVEDARASTHELPRETTCPLPRR